MSEWTPPSDSVLVESEEEEVQETGAEGTWTPPSDSVVVEDKPKKGEDKDLIYLTPDGKEHKIKSDKVDEFLKENPEAKLKEEKFEYYDIREELKPKEVEVISETTGVGVEEIKKTQTFLESEEHVDQELAAAEAKAVEKIPEIVVTKPSKSKSELAVEKIIAIQKGEVDKETGLLPILSNEEFKTLEDAGWSNQKGVTYVNGAPQNWEKFLPPGGESTYKDIVKFNTLEGLKQTQKEIIDPDISITQFINPETGSVYTRDDMPEDKLESWDSFLNSKVYGEGPILIETLNTLLGKDSGWKNEDLQRMDYAALIRFDGPFQKIKDEIAEAWMLDENRNLYERMKDKGGSDTKFTRINNEIRRLMGGEVSVRRDKEGRVITTIGEGRELTDELRREAIKNEELKIRENAKTYLSPELRDVSDQLQEKLEEIQELSESLTRIPSLKETLPGIKHAPGFEELDVTMQRRKIIDEIEKKKEEYEEINKKALELTGAKKAVYDPFVTGGYVSDELITDEANEFDEEISSQAKILYPLDTHGFKSLRKTQDKLGNILIDAAKDAYGQLDLEEGVEANMSLYEKFGESVMNLIGSSSSLSVDRDKLRAINETNELVGGLTFLPGDNAEALKYNQALKEYLVVSKAVELNMDPRTLDQTGGWGWFGTGAAEFVGYDLENNSEVGNVYSDIAVAQLGVKLSSKEEERIEATKSGWNQFSYGLPGFIGMGVEFGMLTGKGGVGKFFKGVNENVRLALTRSNVLGSSKIGKFMVNTNANIAAELSRLVGQGVIADYTRRGEGIPLIFAAGAGPATTTVSYMMKGLRHSKRFRILYNNLANCDIAVNLAKGVIQPAIGTGNILAGEFAVGLAKGDLSHWKEMTKPEQLLQTWGSLYVMKGLRPVSSITRAYKSVESSVLKMGLGTDVRSHKAAKVLDIRNQYLNENFNGVNADKLIDGAVERALKKEGLDHTTEYEYEWMSKENRSKYDKIIKAGKDLQYRLDVNTVREVIRSDWGGKQTEAEISILADKYKNGEEVNAQDVENLGSKPTELLTLLLQNPDFSMSYGPGGLVPDLNEEITSSIINQAKSYGKIVEYLNNWKFEKGSKEREKLINTLLKIDKYELDIERWQNEINDGKINKVQGKELINDIQGKYELLEIDYNDQITKQKQRIKEKQKEAKILAEEYKEKAELDIKFYQNHTAYKNAIEAAGGKLKPGQELSEGFYKHDDGRIFLNEAWARKVKRVSHSTHEILHHITEKVFKDMDPLLKDKMVEQFVDQLSEQEKKIIMEDLKDSPGYKGDKEAGIEGNKFSEEWVNIYHDKVAEGLIKPKESNLKKASNWWKNLWNTQTPFENIDFKDGKAYFEFVKDYSLKAKAGKVSGTALDILKEKTIEVNKKLEITKEEVKPETRKEELAEVFSMTELKDLELERAKIMSRVKDRGTGPGVNRELQLADLNNIKAINDVLNTTKAKVDYDIYEKNKENWKDQFVDAEGNEIVPDFAAEHRVDKMVWDAEKNKMVPVYKTYESGPRKGEIRRKHNPETGKYDGEPLVEQIVKPGLQDLYRGMVTKIANEKVAENIPGFNEKLFIDKLLGGGRGILGLAKEFDGRGSLNGYINGYIKVRSYDLLKSGEVSDPMFFEELVTAEREPMTETDISVTTTTELVDYDVLFEKLRYNKIQRNEIKKTAVDFIYKEGRLDFGDISEGKTSPVHKEYRDYTKAKLFKDIKNRMGDMRYRDSEGNIIPKKKAEEMGLKTSYEQFIRSIHSEMIKFDNEIYRRAKWSLFYEPVIDPATGKQKEMSVEESRHAKVTNEKAGNAVWKGKEPSVDQVVDFLLKRGEFVDAPNSLGNLKTTLAKMISEVSGKGALLGVAASPKQPKLNKDGEVTYIKDKNGEIIMEEVFDAEGNYVRDDIGNIVKEPKVETFDLHEGLSEGERATAESTNFVSVLAMQLNVDPSQSFSQTVEKVLKKDLKYEAFRTIDPLAFAVKLNKMNSTEPEMFAKYLQAVHNGKLAEFNKKYPKIRKEMETLVMASMQERVMTEGMAEKADFVKDFNNIDFTGKLSHGITDIEFKTHINNVKNMRSTYSKADGHPGEGSQYGRIDVARVEKFETQTLSLAPFLPGFLGKGLTKGLLTLHDRTNGEGMSDAKLLERVDLEGNPIMRKSWMNIYDQVSGKFGTAKELIDSKTGKGLYDGLSDHTIKKVGAMKNAFKKLVEAKTEIEKQEIAEEAWGELDNKAKKELYYAWGVAQQRWLNSSKNKQQFLDRSEHIMLIARQQTNVEQGVRQLVPIEAVFWAKGGLSPDEIKIKLEHSKVMTRMALETATSVIGGTWESDGKGLMKGFSGIYGMKYNFDIVDKIGSATNTAQAARMSLQLSQLKNYRTIESNFKETLYDKLLRTQSQELGANLRKLGQPWLKDQVAQFSLLGNKKSKLNLEIGLNHEKDFKLTHESNIKSTNLFSKTKNKDLSNDQLLDKMRITDKAVELANLNMPTKKIRVFDFDDTLATTKSKVLYTMPDGTKGKLTAEQFAKSSEFYRSMGATFDFAEFSKIIEGKKGPLFEVAKMIQESPGERDLFVLTARPQESAKPIFEFLKGVGLDIPLDNITGLADGAPEAKAWWMVKKAAEGYNDFYFADDAMGNTRAVRSALSILDVKSRVQLAKGHFSSTVDKQFNTILEKKTGLEWYKKISPAKAQLVGGKKRYNFFLPPSSYHFVDFLQPTLSKGKEGDMQMGWYKQHLLDPYSKAMESISRDRLQLVTDFKGVRKQLSTIPKNLKKEAIPGWSYSNVARIRTWTKQGHDMTEFGLSKKDLNDINKFAEKNPEIDILSDQLMNINKGDGYLAPAEGWLLGSIATDLIKGLETTKRTKYLKEWQQNVDMIYSKNNLNKLEYLYGTKYRESLEGILYRMKTGTNRPANLGRLENRLLDYINGSIGATMFYNTRSAILQTISAANYLNWTDNNPLKAGKAFVNQPQYWKDVTMVMNSDWLKQRRGGQEFGVGEAEIKNKILQHGFLLTKYGDSFAIATGGATFYRNRLNTYKKKINPETDKLYTESEASTIAFKEMREKGEKSQQSSRPDYISEQQASPVGRFVLHFANTPIQYNKIIMQSSKDLAAGRGDWKSNVSKITYYGALQNALFTGLQQGLFAMAFNEEGEEEKNEMIYKATNSMLDNLLRGLGVSGSVVAGMKNIGLDLWERSGKPRHEYAESTWKLLDVVPSIDIKTSRMKEAFNNWDYNQDQIEKKGFSLDNPAWLSGGLVASSLFNLPLDRLIKKAENVGDALKADQEWWKRAALLSGWSEWNLESTEEEAERKDIRKAEKAAWKKKKKEEELFKGKTPEEIKELKLTSKYKDLSGAEQRDILKRLGKSKDEVKVKEVELIEMLKEYSEEKVDSTLKVHTEYVPSEEEMESDSLFKLNKGAQVTELKKLGLNPKDYKYEKDRVEAIMKALKKKKEEEELKLQED